MKPKKRFFSKHIKSSAVVVETYRGVTKGTSSGWMVSLLFHAGIGIIATSIFLVVQQQEEVVVFHPVVVRPPTKMDLPKPPVRVKMPSKPVRQIARITVPRNSVDRPVVEVPGIGGVGDELVGDIGSIDISPDLVAITPFGDPKSQGNDFIGTFYDLKRTRSGNKKPATDSSDIAAPLMKFVASGWRPSVLDQYYQSPKKLYASYFAVPTLSADVAPEAFGETNTGGWGWAVHYKGKLVHKAGIKFRFRGAGDSVLIVRVDGEIVLDGNYNRYEAGRYSLDGWTTWNSSSPDENKYWLASTRAAVSDWITLEPGVPMDMEILLGDVKGYGCSFMLCVEVDGVEYPVSRRQAGAPVLPIFKTDHLSRAAQDQIHAFLVREQISTTNGPVFNDYQGGVDVDLSPKPILAHKPDPYVEGPPMRMWTAGSGKTIEAEYVALIGDKAALKSSRGKQITVPLSELSAQDIKYIDLVNEPEFKVSFVKKSKSKTVYRTSPYTIDSVNFTPPHILKWTFGAKLEQTSTRAYNHELKVEYFAIGVQENDRSKFILLDRGESSFVPGAENDRSHQFSGEVCETAVMVSMDPQTGRRYDGNLVVVSDKRGKVIAHSASSAWLLEHLDALRVLSVNAYFDKEGRRVLPTNTRNNRGY